MSINFMLINIYLDSLGRYFLISGQSPKPIEAYLNRCRP